MSKFKVTTFMKQSDGTRSRQIDGFDGAKVLVSGERASEVTEAIVERFTRQSAPKRPLGPGGCVRIDDKGIWLLNRADRGWSSSAIHYSSWRDLLNDWDLQLGAPQSDNTGTFWPVLPLAEAV